MSSTEGLSASSSKSAIPGEAGGDCISSSAEALRDGFLFLEEPDDDEVESEVEDCELESDEDIVEVSEDPSREEAEKSRVLN